MTLAERVLDFYRRHARDLPWRRTRDPYGVWVSEIMLQQTRVTTVIPYWERWMARFPTPGALAAARLDDVLAAWSGLGYYSRARLLHRAARVVVERHGGLVPDDPDALAALPGVGPYTAGAIASIAHGRALPVVDGNVARIFARVFAIDEEVAAARPRLWRLAASLLPPAAAGDYNQGLMDIGATICTPRAPRCLVCPLRELCRARLEGRQEELPRRARRRAVPAIDVDAALVVRAGRWLVCRRVPAGLFGGLWELPDVGALAGVTLDRRRVLAEHTHALTHRTITYRVYRATGRPRPGPAYDQARWLAPDALASLGVSSATLALAAHLRKRENPWQTPNARTSSSAKASRRSSTASASSATTSRATSTSKKPRSGPRRGSGS